MSDATAIRTEFTARREGLARAFRGRSGPESKPVRALLIAASSELTISGDRLGGLKLENVFEKVGDKRPLESLRSVRGLQNGPVHRGPPKGSASLVKDRRGGPTVPGRQSFVDRPKPICEAQIVPDTIALVAEHPELADKAQHRVALTASLRKSQPKPAIIERTVKARWAAERVEALVFAVVAIAVGVPAGRPALGRVSVLIHRPFKLEEFHHHRVLFERQAQDTHMLRKIGVIGNIPV
jgi:hypothetical protein